MMNAQPFVHPATIPQEELLKQCRCRAARRSGPGGQHRNKVETAIIYTHDPTGTTAEASERRSQRENQKVALFRLRVNLALNVRMPVDVTDLPTDLWRSRCLSGRISVNPNHDDFPAMLAEALNIIAANDFDVRTAAERLDCTTSQFTKFLKLEPRALKWVNDQRTDRGMHRLK